jgi:hypothetical protein
MYCYRRSGRMEDLEEGRQAYRQASQLALEVNPSEALRAARNWTLWAFERKAWEETLEAYEMVQQALEARLAAQLQREDKTFSIGETRGLAAQAAYAAVQLGRLPEAAALLEAGRAQLLREALERQRSDLHALAGGEYASFYQAYMRAADEVERLQALTFEQRPADWGAQLHQAQAALQNAIAAIRQNVPGFAYFLKPLPFDEIQKQALDAPLVYLAAIEPGGFALVVRPTSEVLFIPLPQLTEKALRNAVNDYLGAYLRWRSDPYNAAARQAWFAALEGTLPWLGEAVMAPLVNALIASGLEAGALVRLIPSGWLGLLPLHAALLPSPAGSPTGVLREGAGGEGGRGKYALDHYTFTYAPSAQALYHAREAAERPADSLLALRYPDEHFQMADHAIQAALALFPADQRTPLLMEQATLEAVKDAFDQHSVLFFFTHGFADFDHPMRSGLLTAGGGRLTLADILSLRSRRARLAALSACETGVSSDLENTDEVVSLPSGLMQSGVPGVVGSLWSVNEVSTAILMSIFFEEWRKNGLTPPQALRRAQQILRDARHDEEARQYFGRYLMPQEIAQDFHVEMLIESFSHPFYWAAFTYTGL